MSYLYAALLKLFHPSKRNDMLEDLQHIFYIFNLLLLPLSHSCSKMLVLVLDVSLYTCRVKTMAQSGCFDNRLKLFQVGRWEHNFDVAGPQSQVGHSRIYRILFTSEGNFSTLRQEQRGKGKISGPTYKWFTIVKFGAGIVLTWWL